MGDKTGIGWTDATWNPVRGCSRVSAGCENCYAETMAGRFKGEGMPYEGLINKHGAWNGQIKLVPEKLDEPLRWTKPRRVFVNSMSDLFHENVPFDYIESVFGVMARCQRHTFQILTKRPERMREWFAHSMRESWSYWAPLMDKVEGAKRMSPEDWPGWPLPNVHLGVSVEDQATADERIPFLLDTPAAVRWVSYEPALGPVDFTNVARAHGYGNDVLHGYRHDFGVPMNDLPASLDWIVVGGESGPGARPFYLDWARDTVQACADSGVPVFVKQIGSKPRDVATVGGNELDLPVTNETRKGDDPAYWPDEIRVQEYPNG